MTRPAVSPECFEGMCSACHGCDGCECHYQVAFEYDPLNDDPVNDPEGD
jgi:hypothetical protein